MKNSKLQLQAWLWHQRVGIIVIRALSRAQRQAKIIKKSKRLLAIENQSLVLPIGLGKIQRT